MTVSEEFKEASTRAAIRALRGLEQTAIMLEKWTPEVFPNVNEKGQKDFGRIMMEAAAEAIRTSWKQAIVEVEAFPDDPANIIEQCGRLRAALFSICVNLQGSLERGVPDPRGDMSASLSVAKEALKSSLVNQGIAP